MLKLHVHVCRFFPTNHFKCKANTSTISKDTWGQLNPMQPSPQCGAGKTIQIITKNIQIFIQISFTKRMVFQLIGQLIILRVFQLINFNMLRSFT